MTELFTKRAVDIFAPTDGGGNLRQPDNAETQVWGTEVERVVDLLGSADDIASVADNMAAILDAEDNADRAETALATIQAIDPALGGEVLDAWAYKRPYIAGSGLPKYTMMEPGLVREPGSGSGKISWFDAVGNPSMPTAAWIRSQIFGSAYLGVEWPIPAYFDLVGIKYHRAPISDWIEVGGLAQYDWHIGVPSHIEDADIALEWWNACDDAGVKKVLPTSRNGDLHYVEDAYSVYLGGADPLRGGLTMAQRLDQIAARAQELAYHLTQTYGAWDAMYIGHEVDHIASITPLFKKMMYTQMNPAYPALRSYGIPIIIALSSPIDAAPTHGIASLIAEWGADVIMEQGSVGTGAKYIDGILVPTYIPTEALGDIPDRSEDFADMIDIASGLCGRDIEKVWNAEAWAMGVRPNADITLSALNGSPVTVETGGSVAAFDISYINLRINGRNGGSGLIGNYIAPDEVQIDADFGDGTNGNFTEFTMAAGLWSLNAGYTDTFAGPMGWTIIEQEVAALSPKIDSVLIYGVDGYIALPNAVAWPAETARRMSDYKTRMIEQGDDWHAAYEAKLAEKLLPGWTEPLAKFTVNWGNITGKPSFATDWSEIGNKPTTLAGYGITDAPTSPVRNTYVPTITFGTPGDLAVTYSTRKGWYIDDNGTLNVGGRIITSAFTHTTASGSFRITLPFEPDDTDAAEFISGSIILAGYTKAGYTQLTPVAFPGFNYFSIYASGSGQLLSTLAAADLPTGGTLQIIFNLTYKI